MISKLEAALERSRGDALVEHFALLALAVRRAFLGARMVKVFSRV